MDDNPELLTQVALTSLFAALAALSFYFALDTLGLETGPLHPDVMMLALFSVLTIGGVVFVYISTISVTVYVPTTIFVASGTVFIQESYRYGAAGVEPPVTRAFISLIITALLLGGIAGFGIKRVVPADQRTS